MSEYYRLAAHYYNRFHGSHLFPKLWNWRWLLCLATFSTATLFTYWYFVSSAPPVHGPVGMFISALVFVGSCLFILHYRSNQVLGVEKAPPFFSRARRLQLEKEKRSFLSSHTQRSSSDFAQLAQEITDLLLLEKAYRSPIDVDFVGVLSKLYDSQTITFIFKLCQLTGGLFILAILLYLLTKQVIEILMLMASSFISKKMGNRTMLNCLVRDLIDLHLPQPVQTVRKISMPYTPTSRVWGIRRHHGASQRKASRNVLTQ